MTKLEQAQTILNKINQIVDKSTFTVDDKDIILDLPSQYIPQWSEYLGKTLEQGCLVAYNNVKYLVMQTITPIETQTPNMDGMLAIYKPYQGIDNYQWIYGEYCEIGFTRFYSGVKYKAIQDPNANIYPPNEVAAIWEIVT